MDSRPDPLRMFSWSMALTDRSVFALTPWRLFVTYTETDGLAGTVAWVHSHGCVASSACRTMAPETRVAAFRPKESLRHQAGGRLADLTYVLACPAAGPGVERALAAADLDRRLTREGRLHTNRSGNYDVATLAGLEVFSQAKEGLWEQVVPSPLPQLARLSDHDELSLTGRWHAARLRRRFTRALHALDEQLTSIAALGGTCPPNTGGGIPTTPLSWLVCPSFLLLRQDLRLPTAARTEPSKETVRLVTWLRTCPLQAVIRDPAGGDPWLAWQVPTAMLDHVLPGYDAGPVRHGQDDVAVLEVALTAYKENGGIPAAGDPHDVVTFADYVDAARAALT